MMWPWSYNVCDRALQPAQEISACAKTRHWDLLSGHGRCVRLPFPFGVCCDHSKRH